MKINHVAIYVHNLEESRAFYEQWFGGISGKRYLNPKTNLQTYFLSFDDGARLELMTRPECTDAVNTAMTFGLTHLAFSAGSREMVDERTAQLAEAGFTILSMPRTTGDGYYESVILDPDGNQIEIVE